MTGEKRQKKTPTGLPDRHILGSTKIMALANMPTPFTGFLFSRILIFMHFFKMTSFGLDIKGS